MEKIGFKINGRVDRLDAALIEGFRSLPSANVDDVIGRKAAVDPAVRARNKAKLVGCAFTVKSPPRDNLMIHKAIDMAKPGDVIVMAAGGSMEAALCGEIMVNYCKLLGLGGVVIDGCIRDIEDISQMDFPVFSRGIIPNGPFGKVGPGEINVPVMFGGQEICPGDLLVGDETGLVVVKPEIAAEALEKARALQQSEQKSLDNIAKGIGLDRAWVDIALKENGCEGL